MSTVLKNRAGHMQPNGHRVAGIILIKSHLKLGCHFQTTLPCRRCSWRADEINVEWRGGMFNSLPRRAAKVSPQRPLKIAKSAFLWGRWWCGLTLESPEITFDSAKHGAHKSLLVSTDIM